MHSPLPILGSLGMGNLESGHQRGGGEFHGKFLQIEFCGLLQVE